MKNHKLMIVFIGVAVALLAVYNIFAQDNSKYYKLDEKSDLSFFLPFENFSEWPFLFQHQKSEVY